MNCLIIYSHPNPASFCHSIKECIVKTLKANGHLTEVRDLYDLDFDPVLKAKDFERLNNGFTAADVMHEQNFIRWAKMLFFVYPVWWTGMPAITKGYIDRVYTPGFAYDTTGTEVKPLLTDKQVIIFNTMGTATEIYEHNGMLNAMQQTSNNGIFQFCGMTVRQRHFFGQVPQATQETLQSMLHNVSTIVGGI